MRHQGRHPASDCFTNGSGELWGFSSLSSRSQNNPLHFPLQELGLNF